LASAHLRWGDIASVLGSNSEAETNLKAAVAQFEGLLRSEPENIQVRVGLAKAHQALAQQCLFFTRQPESGRHEATQAIALWEAVLAARPNDVVARRLLGRSYDLLGAGWGMVGDMKAAVPFIQKAIDVLTEDASADTETKRRLAGALSNL